VSGVRTVYLPCKPALVSISSRFIREIAQYGGDVTSLVPAPVAAGLASLFPRKGTA
jgi:pantetheine-phosphate adenylyltransferase